MKQYCMEVTDTRDNTEVIARILHMYDVHGRETHILSMAEAIVLSFPDGSSAAVPLEDCNLVHTLQ